jgi:hypothetical protein
MLHWASEACLLKELSAAKKERRRNAKIIFPHLGFSATLTTCGESV